MKIVIDKTAIDFMAAAMKVAQKISPEAVLYYSRHEEKLAALLEMKNFEAIVPRSIEPYFLDSVPEMSQRVLWGKGLIKEAFPDSFLENVPTIVLATRPAEVYSYQMNVRLFANELVEEIGGVDHLMRAAFTYSQIAKLASRHRSINSTLGILDYHQPNYFPMVRRDGKLTIASLFSRNEFNRHKKWELWFPGIGHQKYLYGTIMLRQDVENANLRL